MFPASAKSWYTISMPIWRASRGDSNLTGLPSKYSDPSLGLYSPERIFISVDLPAPLSPTTPRASPADTWKLTPFSAVMAPKYFLMSRASSRGTAD
jgi:hypothetical protein